MKKLPTGAHWTYEVKLDGFRVEAVRLSEHAGLVTSGLPTNRELQSRSRLYLSWGMLVQQLAFPSSYG